MTGRRETAGAVRARLVATLTGRLPELRATAAEELLDRAGAGAGTAMRTLDAYLAARRGVFTVAVTECPAAYLRLVQVLLAAGHDVTVPGLRRLQQTGHYPAVQGRRPVLPPLLRAARHRVCARCGTSGRVAARRPEGVICYSCYARDPLVTERCAACGRVRVPAPASLTARRCARRATSARNRCAASAAPWPGSKRAETTGRCASGATPATCVPGARAAGAGGHG